jgi:glutaminyl-peptide cyclotransferase
MSRGIRRSRKLAASAVLAGGLLIAIAFWSTRESSPVFDKNLAFQHLLKQCEFGPRNPGSEGHRRCLEYLTNELGRYGHTVQHQKFTYVSRGNPGRSFEGTNLWATFPGGAVNAKRVLLCAHWDTRPVADQDPLPQNRDKPILGANDGASGVAVLLEVARVLARKPPAVRVDIVLFDLEDMGDLGGADETGERDPFCIGSRHFASQLTQRPDFGILLDMVGKKDLRIRKEGFSLERAPRIVEKVWSAAARVGARAFRNERGTSVYDDHVPFLEKGIPVIDLIDFDYPQWHTVQDTPDQCSLESLRQVGEVLLEVIYNSG